MWDMTFYLTNPSSGATPRCWHKNIVLQTISCVAKNGLGTTLTHLPLLLVSSRNSMVKID